MKEDPLQPYIQEVGHRGAKWLRSKHAGWILGLISFVESVFAPILIDPFLIALILAKREAWIRYIFISVVFSVLGGVFAYFLGYWFFDFIGTKIITLYGLESEFASMANSVDENAFVFVLLGALTPIPYKLVAIASGLTQINFVTYLFASIVGRILRLGLVGWATYAVGPHALPMIRRHLLTLAYILCAVLLTYFFIRVF
jgi:membrane protein YqaA with SNARE-associated domain